MSVNTSPIYVIGGITATSIVAVTDVTAIGIGTGSTVLITGATDGTRLDAISFYPGAQGITGGGLLLIYSFDSAVTGIIDAISIPPDWNISAGSVARPIWWRNPYPMNPIVSADTIRVGKIGQPGAIYAKAWGGNYGT